MMVLSGVVIGAFVPGIVPVVLGRMHELVPDDGQARSAAWSGATVAFALGQAGAAYGYSFLFAETGGYAMLFALGAAALFLALAIDFGTIGVEPRRRIS
jgi:predicted MFS family arabinose efflux permease